jgi:hypothetical protein
MQSMKQFFTLLILTFLAMNVLAQEEKDKKPLFEARKFESDAFVEISGQATRFAKSPAAITRFGLTWTYNHTWSLNATYDMLSSQNNINSLLNTAPDPADEIFVRYQSFGVKAGYVLFHDYWISFHPEWRFAWGQLNYEYPSGNIRNWNFYVGEPMLNAVFNVSSYFRLGLNVSWRYSFGVDLDGMGDGAVNGFAGSLFLRIGQF